MVAPAIITKSPEGKLRPGSRHRIPHRCAPCWYAQSSDAGFGAAASTVGCEHQAL